MPRSALAWPASAAAATPAPKAQPDRLPRFPVSRRHRFGSSTRLAESWDDRGRPSSGKSERSVRNESGGHGPRGSSAASATGHSCRRLASPAGHRAPRFRPASQASSPGSPRRSWPRCNRMEVPSLRAERGSRTRTGQQPFPLGTARTPVSARAAVPPRQRQQGIAITWMNPVGPTGACGKRRQPDECRTGGRPCVPGPDGPWPRRASAGGSGKPQDHGGPRGRRGLGEKREQTTGRRRRTRCCSVRLLLGVSPGLASVAPAFKDKDRDVVGPSEDESDRAAALPKTVAPRSKGHVAMLSRDRCS